MDNIILSLILIAPLAGALLVMLVPDKGKLPAWVALATSLATFLLTLHLPAHFSPGATGFQFVQDFPWIDSPAIRYHVGVDGLSLWLVVLTGLLAPVGVLASWKTIQTRSKVFYALFLVQQTAMLGVFVSLDLMLYYGFWELSLVPMAILTAMYGRNITENGGAKAAMRFFLYTFIPSAPLLVAILWLYARTHSFQFEVLQAAIANGSFPAGPLIWAAFAFLVAFSVKVPVLGLHGWLSDLFSEAPVADGLRGRCRQTWPLFADPFSCWALPRSGASGLPLDDWTCGCRHPLRHIPLLALVQKDFWKLLAYGTMSSLELLHPRYLRIHSCRA